MTRKTKEESYSVISEFEKIKISFGLHSKGGYSDNLIRDFIEITSKVIYSENKNIKKNDALRFNIFIDKSYEDYRELPNYIGVFERSRKMRTGYITVPPTFVDRFSFILNQKNTAYFPLRCPTIFVMYT